MENILEQESNCLALDFSKLREDRIMFPPVPKICTARCLGEWTELCDTKAQITEELAPAWKPMCLCVCISSVLTTGNYTKLYLESCPPHTGLHSTASALQSVNGVEVKDFDTTGCSCSYTFGICILAIFIPSSLPQVLPQVEGRRGKSWRQLSLLWHSTWYILTFSCPLLSLPLVPGPIKLQKPFFQGIRNSNMIFPPILIYFTFPNTPFHGEKMNRGRWCFLQF